MEKLIPKFNVWDKIKTIDDDFKYRIFSYTVFSDHIEYNIWNWAWDTFSWYNDWQLELVDEKQKIWFDIEENKKT